MIVGDHAAAQFAGGSFGERHHSLVAYGIVDDLFAFSSFAKHAADLWRDVQHFGDASAAFYAEVVAGGTSFCMKERGHALSSCDCFFQVRSIWKNNFDKPFGDFTAARIGFATIAAKQRHEFL